LKHIEIFIKGYVQGVGFRYYVYKHAETIRIKGFVMNLPGGEVYVEAEGEEFQLKEFIDILKIGPSGADVKEVTYKESDMKHFEGFSITN